jgi:predicted N-acyltransferase
MAEIELLEGVREAPRDEWNALVGDGSPFLEWEWLTALEDGGTLGSESGWAPRPLAVRENGRLVAACPLYVKGHSEGEFVFDWGWADAAYRAGIRYYPKLLVGVPFTPVSGQRFLTAPDVDRAAWIRTLAAHLRELCLENDLSSVHVNFCREEELEGLRSAGFETRMGAQYHWTNRGYESFEDYLGMFRSKRRNQIRREMREIERTGIKIEALRGDEIPDKLFQRLYQIYRATIDHNPWGRLYLTPEFFELLRERVRPRVCVIVAREGSEVIAATINVEKGDSLYGRYWGTLRDVRYLHFNVCYYAAIDYCIRRGLGRFEAGAGGGYKQLRGLDAEPTYSGHFVADERLAAAVRRSLKTERMETEETIRELRDRSALKPAE